LSEKIYKSKTGEQKMPATACPECEEKVFVDAESEQGDVVSCEECGAELEVVGLDPLELDLYEEKGGFDDDDDEFEDI
jgi:alpha-aminoadipate carrier protein LysW